ncbi:MAG: trehalase family glycosidase [Candidatus Bathyarchaeota archaeon]|nr:trehalase family glycosidase [Candidatus Bathyarchaeota archaeon]
MKNLDENLISRAKSILENNWRGSFTVPSPTLYPHQWSWDSAFIAIGYSHYALDYAKSELNSILQGQWDNGLLPHIIFNPKAKGYFPDSKYWRTNEHSPTGTLTSGITQPPVHAIAALKYFDHSHDKKTIQNWFPKLKKFHQYLLENRDPEHSGFVSIYHPWESGFDNSPRWDEALGRIKPKDLPEYKRSDLSHVGSAEERPTKKDYDRYIYLTEILKKFNYDDKEIYKEIPFKIKDVVFNTILYVANKALFEISKILGKNSNEILEWIGLQEDNFLNQFCPDPKDGLFYDYDVIANQFVLKRTVAALIPIYSGLFEDAIIENTVEWLEHSHFCGNISGERFCKYPVIPSTSLDSPHFAHITYWRGPIWINANWMLYQGLRKYNYKEKADRLREAILKLVMENGFYEYFDPHDGSGHGSKNFSWTASLIIDLLHKCDYTN